MNRVKNIIKNLNKHQFFLDWKITVFNLLNFHKKGNNKDVFIFASARGGSTLLENIIMQDRNVQHLFEPLNWKRFISKRTSLQPTYDHLYALEKQDLYMINDYFNKIFNNKITFHFPFALWKKENTLRPERYVFKFINGKNWINYFEENYDIQVIYLVRHPVATALSRISWGWTDFNDRFKIMLKNQDFKDKVPNDLIELSNNIFSQGTQLEKFVLGWCLENYIPLKVLDRSNWLLISYEEIVLHPEESVARITNFLNIEENETMLNRIFSPSNSNSAFLNKKKLFNSQSLNERRQLVNTWRKKVDNKSIERIEWMLDQFDLNIYKNGDLPKV